MYPFGSGMPQGGPPYNPTMNNASSVPFGAGRWAEQSQNPHPNSYQSDQPGSVPFGAGRWVQPGQSPYSSQQSGSPVAAAYPPQNPYTSQSSQPQYSSQVPYPSLNPYTSSSPYPPSTVYASSSPYPSTCPYPSQISNSSQSHYSTVQTPYPTGNSYQPQPSSCPYPGNQYQSPQHQSPYPPSSTTSSYSSQNAIPYPASSPYPSGNPYKTATYSVAQSSSYPQGSSTSVQRKGTPTVVPAPDFDPVKDASALRKAMRGFGTDEDGLINVICRRTNAQRQEIQRQYKTHFGKDLIEDVISETSGNFQKVLVGLLFPIVDFYVKELNDAMAGIGTDEDVLIEILCTLSNAEIHTIKHVYTRTYGRDLESELKSETSGNFKRLLVSLCAGARDESGRADLESAQNDARDLLNAGELRFGTDESTFNMVLCQRNFQQLRLVFQEYQKLTGHSLEKAIKREFSGDIEDGLLAIFRCVMDKAEFFATRLHKSMAGIGTNDKQLIRIIVTRCEIDMQDIKQAFERLYGKSLKSWVKGDTSGHYKHALYPLIGEERSS